MRVDRRLIAVLTLLSAYGCSDAASGPPATSSAVGSIVVAIAPANIAAGSTAIATATVLDQVGATMIGRTVEWSSSDPAVATIDATGRILALVPGTALIVARTGGKEGQAALTVTPAPVATVTVALAASIIAGTTSPATATIKDINGNVLTGRPVAWSTTDSTIATVSPTGLVFGVSEGGPVTITATSEEKRGAANVVVRPRPAVASVSVILVSDVLIAASAAAARLVVLDATGDSLSGRPVTWSSTNPSVATVDSAGHISALSSGQTELVATVEGKVGRAGIRVEARSMFEGDCVFCWVTGSDPRAPQWDLTRQGYVPQPTDAREQIVIDETFSVPAEREVVWDNKIVWVRPRQRNNILINGRLTVRNSLLLWDQTEHQQTRFDVQRGGVLRIENSFAFSSNAFWVNWEYESGATVSFDHYRGDPWTSINGAVSYTSVNGSTVKLTLQNSTRDATVSISDAHHVWLELYPAPGTYQLSLPPRQAWGSWHLSPLWPGTNVEVSNSYIYARDFSLINDVHATISDTPSGFSVGWAIFKNSAGYVDCELKGLGNPDDDRGVLYQDATWSLPCNNSSLTIKNSVLQRAWPVVWGYVHLKVSNSNLVDPRNFGGPATLEVYDSTIDHIAAYAAALVYLENSRIGTDVQVVDQGSIVYGFQVRSRGSTPFRIYQENGGKYVELPAAGPPWK